MKAFAYALLLIGGLLFYLSRNSSWLFTFAGCLNFFSGLSLWIYLKRFEGNDENLRAELRVEKILRCVPVDMRSGKKSITNLAFSSAALLSFYFLISLAKILMTIFETGSYRGNGANFLSLFFGLFFYKIGRVVRKDILNQKILSGAEAELINAKVVKLHKMEIYQETKWILEAEFIRNNICYRYQTSQLREEPAETSSVEVLIWSKDPSVYFIPHSRLMKRSAA